MALSLEPDTFDRDSRSHSNILDILDEGYDDDHRLHTVPESGGGASDLSSSTAQGHLAGIDDTTLRLWEYEDKMAVLGLVLGSTFCLSFMKIAACTEIAPRSVAPQLPCFVSGSLSAASSFIGT